jgi:hypothetical protein
MSTTDLSWIAEGAEVAVTTGGAYGSTEFVKIGRLTPTVIELVDGRRYRRGGQFQRLGRFTGPSTHVADPKNAGIVNHFARMAFRDLVRQGEAIVNGSGATIHQMDARAVRDVLDEMARKLNTTRKEIDRRAGL